MSSEKLTKKQQKALQFRKSKDVKEVKQDKDVKEVKQDKDVKQDKEVKEASVQSTESTAEPVKKKRKTRRGKKGRGQAGSGSGNRFLVFVGGLPNNVTPNELTAHFKSSAPDHIRIRNDKHIAFLEFDGDKDPTGIQRRMDMALLQTGTELREGKKLNVELTVGGGGNSQDRLAKLQKKNEKLQLETTARLEKLKSKGKGKSPTTAAAAASPTDKPANAAPGIHPDRQRLLQK